MSALALQFGYDAKRGIEDQIVAIIVVLAIGVCLLLGRCIAKRL